MKTREDMSAATAARTLLLLSAVVFLLCALLYNDFILSLLHPKGEIKELRLEKVYRSQFFFLYLGGFFLIFFFATILIRRIDIFLRTPLVANLLLAFLATFVPLAILEAALQPLVTPLTKIFTEDPDRGWKLVPNAEGEWGGVMVKINGKGLVGPELTYAKPPHVTRILYLGDSVTFGFTLESYTQSFTYIVEADIEEKTGQEIETINSGVGGYAPWQEWIYLSSEGIKYDPDIVVIGFVLNDVSQKLSLKRYGGHGRGWQLANTAGSQLENILLKSAIIRAVRQYLAISSFIQDLARYQENAEVFEILTNPNLPGLKEAWNITLENLGEIFDFCASRNIPVVLVIFPFTFQFDDIEGMSAAQRIVGQYATGKGVPVLDMLPILAAKMREEGLTPSDYFNDFDHPSPLGNQATAAALASFLQQEGIVTAITR